MSTDHYVDAVRYAVAAINEKITYDLFYGKRVESPLRRLSTKQLKRHWHTEHKFHGISKFPDTRLVADALIDFRGMDYEET